MAELSKQENMSVDEIIKLRNQLPNTWKWNKCYELPYVSLKTGRHFSMRHWALKAPNSEGLVCSLGLISHDHNTETHKGFLDNDVPVEWVEKSLLIVDSLLAEIERLKVLLNPINNDLNLPVKSEIKLNIVDEWNYINEGKENLISLPKNRDFEVLFDNGEVCRYSDKFPFAQIIAWRELIYPNS